MIWLRDEHTRDGNILYRLKYKGNEISIVFPNYMAAALAGHKDQFPSAVFVNGRKVSSHTSYITSRPGSIHISSMPKHFFRVKEKSFRSSTEANYSVIFKGLPIAPKIEVHRDGEVIASNQ
jgi:hypothetical protein